MANIFNITKLKSFKVGEVQETGALPDVWDADIGIDEGSATLTIPEIETTPKYTEQSKVPYVYLEGNMPESTIVGDMVLGTLEKISELFNATYTAADTTNPEMMKLSSTSSLIRKAIQLEGENSLGKNVVIGIPNAQIVMSIDGTIGKTEVRGASFKGNVLDPSTGHDFVIIKVGDVTA